MDNELIVWNYGDNDVRILMIEDELCIGERNCTCVQRAVWTVRRNMMARRFNSEGYADPTAYEAVTNSYLIFYE